VSVELPRGQFAGAIPTMNGRGFMLEALDAYSTAFVDYAASRSGEVLDMGCAYGVATLAALARGARVCACDMEPRHLDLLKQQAPADQHPRLRLVDGVLPYVTFPQDSFDAILAARVIHFLRGPELRMVLRAMVEWLRPGGRLYLVADTPYVQGWSVIAPAYEEAKARGDEWPGFIPDFRRYSRNNAQSAPGPEFLNTLDPDILTRECERAGFSVERSAFFGLARLGDAADGREHAGCIAIKTPSASPR
jgi:SAM-dependent methyltransferase